MTSARHLRWAAAAASLVVATALLSAAGTAEAVTLQPRTYTAAMTPNTALAGQETSYSVVVKNTSTVISALDHFTLVVPPGFTAVAGTVTTSPRGGWTVTVGSGLVTAITTQPVKFGLRKGESLTFTFKATDSNACDASSVTWVQKADGAIIDPFKAQSLDPTVQMTATDVPRLQVTSVIDKSDPPLHNQVVVGAPFVASGKFMCGTTNIAAGSAGTVTLSKTTNGTPNLNGALGGIVSTAVAAADKTATIDGATYNQVENGVGITATWSGGPGDSFSLTVVGAAETVNGVPGTPIDPAELTVPGAFADLKLGANGPVTIVVNACGTDQTSTAPCSDGTQVELTGDFKDPTTHAPLYSFAAPARIVRVCPASVCPHQSPQASGPEGESSNVYTYNYFCTGNVCQGEGSAFGEREVEEDFNWHPTYVSIRDSQGVYQPFAQAPRCVELPTSGSDPNKDALLTLTGKITNPAAQQLGFCVDVNAITRDPNTFSGTLNIPVLFVEDLRLRP